MLISNDIILEKQLGHYKKELQKELFAILEFWQKNTVDSVNGGFYGRLDNDNKIFSDAPKGSVLNSRILWAFSAAYNLTGNEEYLTTASRAFQYITDYFIDKLNGGIYWTVNFKGEPLDTKKQIYALSFAMYGLSEFYLAGKNEQAKEAAIKLYHLIVEHSYDTINGGYIEALSADWKEIDDLRLSKKDANEKKSMNTHLHVLEGFANLYRIWPDEVLKNSIEELIGIFLKYIIDKNTHHLILFFDEKWNVKSNIISYGHDIEAAWLIQEAAEIINNNDLLENVKIQSVQVAKAAAEGLDKDGGLWYELDADENYLVKEKHWWPQAEAMIGFFNAWQITDTDAYLEYSLSSWKFVQQCILDTKNGEWFWGVKENYELMNEDKVGLWKCPYHNSRACIELIKRINNITGN
ncbi:MAG TPA: AGE family epimerase/isomerase [Ginsengibacter sp.]